MTLVLLYGVFFNNLNDCVNVLKKMRGGGEGFNNDEGGVNDDEGGGGEGVNDDEGGLMTLAMFNGVF